MCHSASIAKMNIVQTNNSSHFASKMVFKEHTEPEQPEEDDDDAPPPGWSTTDQIPTKEKRNEEEDDDEGPPPGWQSIIAPTPAKLQPPASEMAQIVCGSCRRLLSYPKGVRYVQCSCCQMENFVLEAHQVGQVKCGGCVVLLMYPYGAASVLCSSCRFVTKIGEHNRRPPLSVQQGASLSAQLQQLTAPPNRVQ